MEEWNTEKEDREKRERETQSLLYAISYTLISILSGPPSLGPIGLPGILWVTFIGNITTLLPIFVEIVTSSSDLWHFPIKMYVSQSYRRIQVLGSTWSQSARIRECILNFILCCRCFQVKHTSTNMENLRRAWESLDGNNRSSRQTAGAATAAATAPSSVTSQPSTAASSSASSSTSSMYSSRRASEKAPVSVSTSVSSRSQAGNGKSQMWRRNTWTTPASQQVCTCVLVQ